MRKGDFLDLSCFSLCYRTGMTGGAGFAGCVKILAVATPAMEATTGLLAIALILLFLLS